MKLKQIALLMSKSALEEADVKAAFLGEIYYKIWIKLPSNIGYIAKSQDNLWRGFSKKPVYELGYWMTEGYIHMFSQKNVPSELSVLPPRESLLIRPTE